MNDKIFKLNNTSNLILEEVSEITYIGDPVLRIKAKDVIFEEGMEIGKKLLESLLKYKELTGVGVGLAAPQIGISSNVFVTYLNESSKVYINPEITSYSEDQNLYKENCLSSSHVCCDVKRSENIQISYLNEDNEQITNESHNQFSARLIQHEYDHLQGIVNLDKAVVGTIDYKIGNPKDEKLRS